MKYILTILTLLVLNGCGTAPDGPSVSVQSIRLEYASKAMASSVERIVLTVTLDGDQLFRGTYDGAGTEMDTLDLPIADGLEFTAQAYDSAGSLIYEGKTVAGVGEEDYRKVTIVLRPVFVNWSGLYVGFVPSEVSVKAGSTFTMELVAGNVDSLFGFACQIVYDTSLLAIDNTAIRVGTMLGSDVVSLFSVDDDTVSIGVTRKNGDPGMSGEGSIVYLDFTARAVGADTLEISDSKFKMTKSDGSDVDSLGTMEKGVGIVTTE